MQNGSNVDNYASLNSAYVKASDGDRLFVPRGIYFFTLPVDGNPGYKERRKMNILNDYNWNTIYHKDVNPYIYKSVFV